MKMSRLLWLSLVFLLASCASRTVLHEGQNTIHLPAPLVCSGKLQPQARVQLDMVDSLIASGRQQAALAELLATPMDSIQHWLRYAQLQAGTGQLERSGAVFHRLAEHCDSAEAWHGLGMVQLKRQQLDEGLTTLKKAVRLLPADPALRNDYGYGLMMAKQYSAAVFQLRTALELGNGTGPSRQNLAVAYLLSGDRNGLAHLRQQYAFSDDELAYAKRLAATFNTDTRSQP